MMTQEEFIGYFQLWEWNWDKIEKRNKYGYLAYSIIFKRLYDKISKMKENLSSLVPNNSKNLQQIAYIITPLMDSLRRIHLYIPVKIKPLHRLRNGRHYYKYLYVEDHNYNRAWKDCEFISYLCQVFPYCTDSLVHDDIIIDFSIDTGVCDEVSVEEDVCLYEVTLENDKLIQQTKNWLANINILLLLLKGIL